VVVAAVKASPSGFDRVARVYRALEYLAFGRDLERARFCLLPELAGCRRVLVLGEGDGRFLLRLVEAAPEARVHCVDRSAAMLALASARVAAAGASGRVTFEQADVLEAAFPSRGYDALVTLFFLDCFTAAQVAAIAARLRPALVAGGRWLFADFAVPARGPLRWRAQAWLRMLYCFFGWRAALAVRFLPPSEQVLLAAGLRRLSAREFQGGLLRSVIFDSPGGGARL
jgi:ubiquinone/menaquinone biosynthesis C-methylase UbiE